MPIAKSAGPASLISVRDRAGLAGVRFHDLRHTCITLLLNLGDAFGEGS